MPIKVTCPKCQGVLHAPDDAGGKRGKCPTCGTVLAIPAVAETTPPERPFAAEPPFRTGTASAPALGQSQTAMDTDARRSSFGTLADDSPARASANRMTSTYGPGDSKRPADPFARSAPASAAAPAGTMPTDSETRGYRRCRRGLTLCGLAYTLFFLAAVAFAIVPYLKQFGVPIPDQTPGYLKLAQVSTATEIHSAAVLVPLVLGAIFLLFGRTAAGGAPRSSGARGTFKWSAFFTLLTLAGLGAYAVPTAMAIPNGVLPDSLLMPDDPSGMAQRAGLATAAVCAPLAELLFWFGLGRLGAGLGDARLSGRVTRYLAYAAIIYVVVGISSYAVSWYGPDVNRFIASNIQPELNKLGENQKYLLPAALGVVAVSAWIIYSRAIGAGRKAVRGWLERYA